MVHRSEKLTGMIRYDVNEGMKTLQYYNRVWGKSLLGNHEVLFFSWPWGQNEATPKWGLHDVTQIDVIQNGCHPNSYQIGESRWVGCLKFKISKFNVFLVAKILRRRFQLTYKSKKQKYNKYIVENGKYR